MKKQIKGLSPDYYGILTDEGWSDYDTAYFWGSIQFFVVALVIIKILSL